MKLRTDDKQWLSGEVARQLEVELDKLRPHGFRRWLAVAREIGPVVGHITILVALLSVLLASLYYSFSRVEKQARFEEKTAGRLDSVESTVRVLSAQLVISKLTSLPAQELKKHRGELIQARDIIASAPRDTPNFWSSGLEVISLTSKAISYISNPKATHSEVEDSSHIHVAHNGDTVVLKGRISDSYFENTVIEFDPEVQLSNVTFKNCVFIFPSSVIDGPPPNIKKIGSILLTANIADVTVSSS